MEVDLSEYTLIENENDFLKMWPPFEWGKYRPQPCENPYEYPCMVKEICIQESSNGSDYAILSILYFKKETPNEE